MTVRIINGDSRTALSALPDQAVHCCVTSPPYFGLRDYGVSGQIGLEPTPDEYVAEMVAVFREVRRVLRDDGTLWLNIGDSYAGGGNGGGGSFAIDGVRGARLGVDKNKALRKNARGAVGDCKPKDLIGIPWRVAFALQADGWYLRQDIIWHKPNPMPESVQDRCTKAHEYVFLLSKRLRYFFDAEAIKEPAVTDDRTRSKWEERSHREPVRRGDPALSEQVNSTRTLASGNGRNRRSVWTVPTVPFTGAHFATFPPDLIRPCIMAGCPIDGTVLDPFMGSGTTGLVAHNLRRNCIGVELNPEYIQIATARLKAELVDVEGGIDVPPTGLALFDTAGAA